MSDWRDGANCKTAPTSWFYPPVEWDDPRLYRQAARLCVRCPVRQQCLEDALTSEELTVWAGFRGGLTPKQRQVYVKDRTKKRPKVYDFSYYRDTA